MRDMEYPRSPHPTPMAVSLPLFTIRHWGRERRREKRRERGREREGEGERGIGDIVP